MNPITTTPPQAQVRNSGFELLRLILMFLIIIHHGIVHGLGLTGLSWGPELVARPDDMFWCCLVNCFCIPAVNVFVLISGYFGIKPTRNKFLKLLVSTALYTFVFTCLAYWAKGDILHALTHVLFLSHTCYWFILDYLCLMCFAPLLNMFCEQSTQRLFRLFLASMLILTCYLGFVWRMGDNVSGYTLLQFILMYCLGRYAKRFDLSLSKAKSAQLYLGATLLCGLGMYGLYRLNFSDRAWQMTQYSNPLLILAAVAAVLLFKNFHFSSKLINRLALSSLAIYLVQSSYAGNALYRFIKYLYQDCEIGGGYCADNLLVISCDMRVCHCDRPTSNEGQ